MERTPIEALSAPEKLVFTMEEARIGIRALSFNLLWTRMVSQENLQSLSLQALVSTAESAHEFTGSLVKRAELHGVLSSKLAAVNEDPNQSIELSDAEILLLGDSLYHLENFGLREARAHASMLIRYYGDNPGEEARFDSAIEDAKVATSALFMALDPIAKERGIKLWYDWPASQI